MSRFTDNSVVFAFLFGVLGAGCSGGFPAEVTVVPFTCEQGADCGAGRCVMEGGDALCLCAPGSARTHPHLCEPLVRGTACYGTRCEESAGCTSPEHCGEGEVCERLSGRCLPAEAAICAEEGPVQLEGERPVGGVCFLRSAPEGVSGCGSPGPDDRCQAGLICAPTGRLGRSVVCGAPENALGVCRRPCSLCGGGSGGGASCLEGEGCFFVEGYGGVCLREGYAEGECGEGLCRPGESCLLGGTLGGYAHGNCRVPCEEGESCPDPGHRCRPENDRFPNQLFCGE